MVPGVDRRALPDISARVAALRDHAGVRDIRRVRRDFADAAERAAAATVRERIRRFEPGSRMSKYAHWFVTDDDAILVAVVSGAEKHTVVDEVLAYGLAWQSNRDLYLVLPPAMIAATLTRLPWIDTPVQVWVLEGSGPHMVHTLSRIDVFERLRDLPPRVSKRRKLTAEQDSWLTGIGTNDLDAHDRSYLSWHHQGLQVLKVTGTRKYLRIQAGVQYSGKSVAAEPYDRTFVVAPTAEEVAEINAEIGAAVKHGASKSSQMREHRMQATLETQGAALGLEHLFREYPAYRGLDGSESMREGRPGYIDFLGVDKKSRLHVVETKIGHDPCVVIQALDYAIWVRANEDEIRAQLRRSGCDIPEPKPDPNGDRLHMHLVLGPDAKSGLAFNAYLAPQLEALKGDCHVAVHLVPDVTASPLELRSLSVTDLWAAGPLVAEPVTEQRWAGMLTRALMAVTRDPTPHRESRRHRCRPPRGTGGIGRPAEPRVDAPLGPSRAQLAGVRAEPVRPSARRRRQRGATPAGLGGRRGRPRDLRVRGRRGPAGRGLVA